MLQTLVEQVMSYDRTYIPEHKILYNMVHILCFLISLRVNIDFSFNPDIL